MRTKIFSSLLIFLFVGSLNYSQLLSPDNLFPHKVGDMWQFQQWYGLYIPPSYYEVIVVRDSLAEDKSIFVWFEGIYDYVYRIDTLNNVYEDPFGLNQLKYKLNADSGDTWISYGGDGTSHCILARINNIHIDSTFFCRKGEYRLFVDIYYYHDLNNDSLIDYNDPIADIEQLVSGIGLTNREGLGDCFCLETLHGCVINGDTLGNIWKVGIKEIENIPTDFILYQNYPNPFNPTTKIRFSTPPQPSPYQGEGVREGLLVTLKVYNILGQEIATLVNEEKSPGIYEVEFDGSSLSSGVYFYKIQCGEFLQIKKMTLLK